MISRLPAIFLLSVFCACFCVVWAHEPTHTVTRFQNLPTKLFFFDNTESVVYHDQVEGNVYVSSDEGKSWSLATDIPTGDAMMVIPHPFDNNYAFVLTRGTTHYRSEDRGQTWRPFYVPIPPALVPKPLSFHSEKSKYGYILYQGTKCDNFGWGGHICHDDTYYTKQAFLDTPQLLLRDTSRCQFAHSNAEFKHVAHLDLIYCVAYGPSSFTSEYGPSSGRLSSGRLLSSTDFFTGDYKIEGLGISADVNVLAFAVVSKFAVVALRDLASDDGEILLYVTMDMRVWAKAQFPHSSSAPLRENAFTIVESSTHSLAVDVKMQDPSTIGTLFVSNSNGTFFVESLKNTNRDDMGYVDYEKLYGMDGIGLASIVANAEDVEGRGADKKLKTMITFDDGSSWAPIVPPSTDYEGRLIECNPTDVDSCSLHLYSVTTPHNFGRVFSSPSPGFVMGVGSIGATLDSYENSATFLSTNAGADWKMVARGAHKHEFGDQGSILVLVSDEESVSNLQYSTDLGKSWISYDFGIKIRPRALMTIPDPTSQKFILLGQQYRADTPEDRRVVVIFLDFAATRKRQCQEADFERWYARTAKGKECLMGHKQWHIRRNVDADCYVGLKFQDPANHEEHCLCGEEDFECDYNFVRNGDECIPLDRERIPAGVCTGVPDQTYEGSSGWRKIPGNTCVGGLEKDKKVTKKCSPEPAEGEIIHQTFEFPSQIVQHAYFKDSTTILVRLADHSMWQSSNDGYAWKQLFPGEHFLAFYHHTYTNQRAYLITNKREYWYTTDTGRSWYGLEAPTVPNTFQTPILQFHPKLDYLIWTGDEGCTGLGEHCHAKSHYSRNNGRKWTLIDKYVRKCAWAENHASIFDSRQILCESYRDKVGSQKRFRNDVNALQLIDSDFFSKTTKLFDNVVGFTRLSEYLIVAEYLPQRGSLDLQVSLDGRTFATGRFPPDMHPESHAYTILESSTNSIFLHMTMSEYSSPYWGHILKSNSNGTFFGLSIENVNRDERGLVDFEKMIGLDGIALINIVSNPNEARITKRRKLQTRITHNDGGSWKPLKPPPYDSMQQKYECNRLSCTLHLHGYTERSNPQATYSTPSVVGLMMAVGNVGEELAPYAESDTFLSRDAGFTWEEVHKDAHLWAFGDSGSILIIANDEEPTDHVLFSTNEGIAWREYKFGGEKIRVRTIITVTSDTSRRFMLMGNYPRSSRSIVVYLDFSALTRKPCTLNVDDPGGDDFELWSPSERRDERCLFGRQTLYHRRRRDANCVVGNLEKVQERVVNNCTCAWTDFECEFNYAKNENDECVLVPQTTPLPDDISCRNGEEFWYTRTAYRQIPFSSCGGGLRLDLGAQHACFDSETPTYGVLFWFTVILIPVTSTCLVVFWCCRRSRFVRGTIRLPDEDVQILEPDRT